MEKPEFLDQLINMASAAAGSDYKLAKALEVTSQRVSDWRHGRQKVPAADVALMAHLAGMDAEAWASRALIWQYEGTPKGEKIAAVLGKALAVTGAALGSFGASAATLGTSTVLEPVSYLIRCILC